MTRQGISTFVHKKTKTRVFCSGVSIDGTRWRVSYFWKDVTCPRCKLRRVK